MVTVLLVDDDTASVETVRATLRRHPSQVAVELCPVALAVEEQIEATFNDVVICD